MTDWLERLRWRRACRRLRRELGLLGIDASDFSDEELSRGSDALAKVASRCGVSMLEATTANAALAAAACGGRGEPPLG